MATRIQFRRGTTAQHATFTGALGEMTVDTDKDCVVVHDGSTAGGFEMARSDANNIETNAITATHLNVSGNGTSGQLLFSDGDGSFSWNDNRSVGYGQSWRNISVGNGTTYTNSSSRAVMVYLWQTNSSSTNYTQQITINGVNVHDIYNNYYQAQGSFIVPPGHTYRVYSSLGSVAASILD